MRTAALAALALAAANVATVPVEFFRVGKHTDASGRELTFTSRDLDDIVATYDPLKHTAPIVIGHPKTDAPAYGWAASLSRKGDALEANVAFADGFKDVVKAGHYRKVSASLYLPTSPGNPTPGKMHLKHIGFLGAQPPAIKGLRPIELAADPEDGAVTIEFAESEAVAGLAQLLSGVRAWIESKFDADAAELALPKAALEAALAPPAAAAAPPAVANHAEAATLPVPAPLSPPIVPAFAKGAAVKIGAKLGKVTDARGDFVFVQVAGESEPRWFPVSDVAADATPPPAPAQPAGATATPPAGQAATSLAEQQLRERELAVKLAERKVERERHESWLDRLVRDGKPLPAQRADIVALFEVCDANTVTVSFAEPNVRGPSDVLRAILTRIATQIDFGEHTAGEGVTHLSEHAAETELVRRADEIQAEAAKRGVRMTNQEAVAKAIKGV